ncbi:MAG: CRR6 family NdhI maturation factor [Leptolyngbyaceae cyanobacterium]
MTTAITLDSDQIYQLDLTPVNTVIESWLAENDLLSHEQQLQLKIDFPRDPQDPRELSEITEIRLWFIRLDAVYPWIALLLDWKSGELARYVAMLVPHQFHPKDGIQYNPEALEIFVMHKIFVLSDWLKSQGIDSVKKPKAMAQMLGYELDDALFKLV